MDRRLVPTCQYGHQATLLCVEKDCNHSSLICDSESCDTSKQHYSCNLNIKVQKFIDCLMRKVSSVQKLDDPVIDLYNHCIKILSCDKDQYIKNKNILGFGIKEEELKVFDLMKKGHMKDILPRLVFHASESMKKEPIVTAEKMNQQFVNDIKLLKKQMQSILREVKSKWSEKQKQSSQNQIKQPINNLMHTPKISIVENVEIQQWGFNKQLCAKGGMEISKDGRGVKRTAIQNSYHYCALISPSLQINNQSKRFEFKMTGNSCLFGIGYKKTLKNKEFKNNGGSGIGKGVYFVTDNGWIYSHHKQDQDEKSTEFWCDKGNVVVMDVDVHSLEMAVYNKSRPQKRAILNFMKRQGDPLHALVKMYNQNEQIQLISAI